MKYVSKIITFILIVIIFSVVVICTGIVFSVDRVDVTFDLVSAIDQDELDKTQEKLNDLKGLNILLIGDRSVQTILNQDETFALVELTKEYPSNIRIRLKERVETFAVVDGELYKIYDADGVLLHTASTAKNSKDDGQNILVDLGAEKAENVFASCFDLLEQFAPARLTISKIEAVEQFGSNDLIVTLACGVKIEVRNYQNNTKLKIDGAYAKFSTLSDLEKSRGVIVCGDGEIPVVSYSATER